MITVTSVCAPGGKITIRKRRQTGSYVYEQGNCSQSEADDQGVSLSSYIHALYSLIVQKRCNHVLMIGCGGGTLATLLTRIGVRVTVVDNTATAFGLARRYFQLPDDVRCVAADGADYLMGNSEIYDAIVLDAYTGSRIPQHLRSLRFLRLIKRRLERFEGAFLANVCLDHDFDLSADRFAETASAVWSEGRILDARGHLGRNAIVMAGAVSTLETPTLLVRPNADVAAIEFDLGCLKFREGRLTGGHYANARFRRLARHQGLDET